MDEAPPTTLRDDREPPTPSRDELLRVLAESEAEAEAGLLVSGDKVVREVYEAAAKKSAPDSGRRPARSSLHAPSGRSSHSGDTM